MRRAPAAALLAGAGALAAFAVASERRPEAGGAAGASAAHSVPAAAVPTQAAEPGPLPPSLRGTEPSGELRVDARGRFAPDAEALALFDYFLSATGEEPDAAIRARIVAEMRRRLAPQAAQEAEALLDLYLAYRAKAAEISESDPWERFQQIRALRTDVFGAALAESLFGEEERIVAVDLERRRVLERSDLAPEERESRIAALDAELPPAEREARRLTLAAVDLRAAEAALRAQGAGEAEIRGERERRFGPEAADRLAALDARRAAWSDRVSAYRAERDALAARGLPPDEYAQELASLRSAHFQGPEILRIEALDRIEEEQKAAESKANDPKKVAAPVLPALPKINPPSAPPQQETPLLFGGADMEIR